MKPIPNDVDWSATAAWIALAISITGTILGPIITTILTNRFQLRLKQMDIVQNAFAEKNHIVQTCISSIGACIACSNTETQSLFGKTFHNVYPFVSTDNWKLLDSFYQAVIDDDYDTVKKLYPSVIHLLSELLITQHQGPHRTQSSPLEASIPRVSS
jgi:hypothetical protein